MPLDELHHGIIFLHLQDLVKYPGKPFPYDFLYWSLKLSKLSLNIIISDCDRTDLEASSLPSGCQYDIMALLTKLYNLATKMTKKIYEDDYLNYSLTILLYPLCGHEPILVPELTHLLCEASFQG